MNQLLETKIIKDSHEVDNKLEFFGVLRSELLYIVRQVVNARSEAVDNDPVNAEGLFAYIYGVRSLRTVFRLKGWLIDRTNNIESIYNPKLGIKIIYQNTDTATKEQHPRAISIKGPATRKIVERGNKQLYLIPEYEEEDNKALEEFYKNTNASIWFFCVAVNGDEVRAELSRPRTISEGQFNGYFERIFILKDDEFTDNPPFKEPTEVIDDQDFTIEITRKEI